MSLSKTECGKWWQNSAASLSATASSWPIKSRPPKKRGPPAGTTIAARGLGDEMPPGLSKDAEDARWFYREGIQANALRGRRGRPDHKSLFIDGQGTEL